MEDVVVEIEEAEFVVGHPLGAFAVADVESLVVPTEEAVVVEVISSSYYLVEVVLVEIVLA